MGALAVALVRKGGYRNAGTLEFLLDEQRRPYFLEMNARLQVEHPVTEMVTGQDLVKLQIRVAQGEPLPFAQGDLRQSGHAIECRVYAEDPDRGFLPSPGRIEGLRVPGGPGVRDDSGVYPGYEVPVHYDPLISKLVVHGADRPEALARMSRALSEYKVLGIKTTLPFFERVLRDPAFCKGDFDTSFVDRFQRGPEASPERPWQVAVAVAAVRGYRDRQAARLAPAVGTVAPSAWWQAGLREAQRGRT
jgi:acetyl-CoA carboxylase biotin carboxylase subunit